MTHLNAKFDDFFLTHRKAQEKWMKSVEDKLFRKSTRDVPNQRQINSGGRSGPILSPPLADEQVGDPTSRGPSGSGQVSGQSDVTIASV